MKTKKNYSDPIDPFVDPIEAFPEQDLVAPQEVVVEADDDSDRPPWAGGNKDLNPHRPDHDGKPDHAGSKKGELFGDQIVLFRDLDPTDGGGDGEPVLDIFNDEPQLIAVGYDPDGLIRPDDADGLFPIYFEEVGEGDYEIPPELVPYVQEVELERANVARAPEKVMDKALNAALDKIETSDAIETDPAGRIVCITDDVPVTIDAPLENLALYQYLMTPEGEEDRAWPSVTDHWPDELRGLLGDKLTDPDWDPSSLLGAAWSKTGEITVDAMIYENTTLGINKVTGSGETLNIDYFDFSDGNGELYDYDRSVQFPTEEGEPRYLRWIEVEDGAPVFKYGTVNEAVFGGDDWVDAYLAIDENGADDPFDDDFSLVDATSAGVNDFAQAADDSRAVIEFMHTNSAVEVDASEVSPEFLADALLI